MSWRRRLLSDARIGRQLNCTLVGGIYDDENAMTFRLPNRSGRRERVAAPAKDDRLNVDDDVHKMTLLLNNAPKIPQTVEQKSNEPQVNGTSNDRQENAVAARSGIVNL